MINRKVLILFVLISVLSIAMIWRDQPDLPAPSHNLCKESLVTQIITGACTLRHKR